MRLRRLSVSALSCVTALGVLFATPMAASAGEASDPTVIMVNGSVMPPSASIYSRPVSGATGSKRLVAKGGQTMLLYPSASADARTMTAMIGSATESGPIWPVTVRRDGREVALLESRGPGLVSADGATVWFPDAAKALMAFDVASRSFTPACSACPVPNDLRAGNVSPNGRFVALMVRPDGAEPSATMLEIRRVRDGRRVAALLQPFGSQDSTMSWSPDSRSIAFTAIVGDPLKPQAATVGIRTLSVTGEVADTAFMGSSGKRIVAYVSPTWLGGKVWALRLVARGMGEVTTFTSAPVSAADFNSAPRSAGPPLTVKADPVASVFFQLTTFALQAPARWR